MSDITIFSEQVKLPGNGEDVIRFNPAAACEILNDRTSEFPETRNNEYIVARVLLGDSYVKIVDDVDPSVTTLENSPVVAKVGVYHNHLTMSGSIGKLVAFVEVRSGHKKGDILTLIPVGDERENDFSFQSNPLREDGCAIKPACMATVQYRDIKKGESLVVKPIDNANAIGGQFLAGFEVDMNPVYSWTSQGCC